MFGGTRRLHSQRPCALQDRRSRRLLVDRRPAVGPITLQNSSPSTCQETHAPVKQFAHAQFNHMIKTYTPPAPVRLSATLLFLFPNFGELQISKRTVAGELRGASLKMAAVSATVGAVFVVFLAAQSVVCYRDDPEVHMNAVRTHSCSQILVTN